MEKRRVYDFEGNVDLIIVVDKIAEALEANGFVKDQRCFYKRSRTNRTPWIHVKEWHNINVRDKHTTIATHVRFEKNVCEYAGYILIKAKFDNTTNEILSAVCVMDCDDISVLNTTYKDIRKKLAATGYFGTHDFY